PRHDGGLTAAPMINRPVAHARSDDGSVRRWIGRGWLLWAYLALNVPLAIGSILGGETGAYAFRSAIGVLATVALAVGVWWQRPAIPDGWVLLAAGTAASAGAASVHTATLLSGSPPGAGVTWVQKLYVLALV